MLEEICNLGRAPEYICQKPSIQKADGTVAVPPARSSHAAEEASSEDEEEEEALHTFSQQQGEPESTRQSVPVQLYDIKQMWKYTVFLSFFSSFFFFLTSLPLPSFLLASSFSSLKSFLFPAGSVCGGRVVTTAFLSVLLPPQGGWHRGEDTHPSHGLHSERGACLPSGTASGPPMGPRPSQMPTLLFS